MKDLVLFSVLFCVLQGCTNIAQPTAKRPLVDKKRVENLESVPQATWHELSDSEAGSIIMLKSQSVRLGESFFAATGKECRKFYVQQELVRLVCRDHDSKEWHFIKPVISEYVENK